MPQVSLVVPVLDEAENVPELARRIADALAPLDLEYELLFVDDGSTDGTDAAIQKLQAHHAQHPQGARVRFLSLSRNFGHQAALFAGLEHAAGDAVITLDGDLQHPPEMLPAFIQQWRAGFEIVQGVRTATADAGALKRASSRGFYQTLSRLAHIRVQPGAADFRLMTRPAVNAFLACRERVRFNRGLVQWIGFRSCDVPYDAPPRFAGRTKYTWSRMWRLAADAIFSFSSWPLRVAGLAGVIVSAGALAYLLFVLWAYFFTERTIAGWTSILATLLVLGGVQLIVLWIIGEYLGRLYEEAKQRPIYILRDESNRREERSTDVTDERR